MFPLFPLTAKTLLRLSAVSIVGTHALGVEDPKFFVIVSFCRIRICGDNPCLKVVNTVSFLPDSDFGIIVS
ncbi:hypothetical protein, partial [Acinetobacter baumannii]|uniref:hypothetical protein n=1 Tax=Acinetobacter baumannii TaxID=470 RepID=UPI001BC88EC0